MGRGYALGVIGVPIRPPCPRQTRSLRSTAKLIVCERFCARATSLSQSLFFPDAIALQRVYTYSNEQRLLIQDGSIKGRAKWHATVAWGFMEGFTEAMAEWRREIAREMDVTLASLKTAAAGGIEGLPLKGGL